MPQPSTCSCRTLTPTCPCHLFFRTFKTAVCPASNPPNASAGLQGNNSYSYYMPLPSVFQGVQDCRLPALKPPKRFQPSRRPPRQQLLQLHAPAICFCGGSRLPFARPQTLQTLPQASKATTLTATTCPCHLFFRGFKTAVCPPSNPPNASNPPAGLQGNNSYSYMPLPSVFQGVQDCRLPALKPPKRFQPFRRPPRQQLLQLHAPAICFSGGSRLPFARPPPNASNPSAGLQGNNSYSYMPLPSVFQGVQDCRLPALKPPKRFQPFRRPPRQQLLQLLHAPAICFSGGSRLPFARPQTPQTLPTLPQASKATTLTATTCPCHLFFRGFKTAVCPPSNPPNCRLPALKGNNSYSYMPLPSVFQGVQDCRLPALKPPKRFQPSRRPPRQQLLQLCQLHAPAIYMLLPNSYTYMPLPSVFQDVQDCRLPGLKPSKRFRRPPRQQLLQLLHAPAICFSGGSRLPFARPQTPQTLPTLPQASKATTLTATCPCHLFLRGFKTAVCPASNPPNASAGLQGNNSYSYMPLPSVFQGVQDCRLPALPQICFCGGSRLPFARPQTLQTLPQASKATTLTATCPCHLFFRGFKTAVCPPSPKRFQPSRRPPRQQLLQLLHAPAICFLGGSRLPFARPQTPQTLPTLPQASKATTLTATCPCHLFFRGFKTAVCPPSNPPNASNPSAGLQGNNSYSYMPLPSVFQGVQDCRLPALPQTLPTLPQASKATTLTATCPCHLFFRGFKTAVCPPSNPPNASAGLQGNNSYSYYMPLPSVFQGVQDCRLPALKPPKRFQPFRRPPRQQLLQLHAPAICFSGGSRLPFARPQTPQTLPQASKATTLTATTCPCHLFFRGFKTAVCPPSNPPNASNPPAGLQGNNSYSYMPLPSVFQGVQDCRLPALKPPKRFQPFRRPPRQQLLQLHAPAISFSGGLKTAVCPPSNPPNASNPSAGLQGNNSYSYMPLPSVFQGVQDCRLPALKPPKRFRRPPRQQLLQLLHAPAICFSGGSRLPFARPQTPQTLPTLPQASKATTLTATCPCHLFFRGFKTAVCPPSNPPNASAGLQGNNSYSYYMPLPSVFQGVQDCRLPALKPPKRFQPFRRPPRQQLLQLHAPAICFSGGSRLPFARPQTPQTLPTLPQASKATTLTATTCPCHLFFRGFKTAVCPPSNPPNASNPSAGLQGNNSYSYMPLPSVFQGVQDCRLPGLKPSKRFRRPPRQQLLQLLHAPAICFSGGSRLPFARPQTPQTLPTLPQASKATTLTATCPCHLFFRGFKTAVCPPSNPPNASNPSAGLQGNNSYSYMPLPSVFQGVQDCRLPALKPPKRFQPSRRPPRQQLLQLHAPAICFSGGSRLPFARPQTPKRFQPFRRPPRQQLLQLHAPAISFSGGSRLPFARPQTPQTLPQASKATTLTATCPCHLFFRGFKTAVCPPSNPPNASAGLQGNNSYSYYMPLPSVFQGVQDCRLPALKPPKRFQPFRRPPRQQLLQLHAPAICFSGGSRLPFARPQTLQTLPQASKATTLTATTCPCHLFFRGFKTAVCPPSNPPNASNPSAGLQGNNSYSYMPLPSVFQGVQDCRLPALKPPKRFQPSRRPPRQQLLQLHAPAICFSGGSRLPFARPQTPQTLPTLPQASKATTLTATCPCHLFFRGFKTAVCPASNPPNASAGLQGNNSYSYYMPLPSVFQGVQDCRLPGLKPPKRFQPSRRPPRQQLLQLHAPAICFSGGSRLPFARPQTPQTLPTLPQASKATTLTATCPCHLFFRGFKTAVCPPSNPPNASNPPAGLQGNNSYSYMPLPSVFAGVQDCRLPGLKPSKRFRRPPRQQLLQLHAPAICFSGGSRLPFARPPPNASKRFRRPPRQQLLQLLHAPAICFLGGSRLPFARPQTPQTLPTLPQASKATTLTATCPCHLFFRGFKTAVCPPSNPPNASNPSAGLQGNNSYSYMPLPSVFQGVQDCRLPALKPPKRFQPFRRPPRQQLLQLHAPAICFSGGSRLPFARPQTPQTLPQASKATTLTATTCPCHLFFRGFKTAVCPPSNPPNASNPSAGLQGNNSYSYMPLPSVFQGVQDCRLPALKPPKRFRRPPRQQLLQLLHAPAICFSGGSRLPFARPQTPQTLPTLPQASKATTLTATCPCHLFFRGFKTAVCPPSNPPNASNPSAGLQGNNSYSYMPLPSLFQGVQDCRLPALKPPKRFQPFRRPPRQQLLQLHAPAICFSGGSRLPFARPQTPQTLPTLPQASKATTLTATTCPCHLFFRGFKTAVCPPSNPPNASAGLQGNNSYSYYMPLPSVFQGVQDCRLPALKPPKRFQPFRRPPRQQLLQLHAPAICFSGGSRLPFARPQTPQTLPTLPQASKATTLTATTCPCHLFFRGFKTAVCPPSNPPNASNPSAGLQGNNSYSYMPLPSVFQGVQDCRLPGLKPSKRFRRPPRQQLLQLLHAPAICFSGGSRLPFARPQTPQTLPTLPQASKATTLTATCPCHLFFRGLKTAVCPPSNPPNASAGLQGNNSYSYYMPLPSVFQGVQDCRLPALKPPKRFQPSRRPPRQQLLQLHAPAICFSGGSRLPFARPQTPQTLPQASKATTLTATTCPCHLFFRGFKTAVCPPSNPPNASNPPAGLQGNNSYSYMPLPSVFQGVQDCRLPALKPPKRFQPFRRPPRQQLLQLHAPAICFSGGSRLPFARPQTPQTLPTLPQASKATTLTATCPCHLFFRGFKTAVCPPSNPPNASNPSAGLQGNNSYSYYMPLPSVFQGVQDCRLPALKPPKRFQPFRRPPRQQLLQLHAPAICFSGGSRLPFARPQTPQTLPQASKATTLTATCPCHLFFRGFKTAVCPPSNPPNASNPPAGLQGNNSYSYMPLPSVFQGAQDCRLPALKPPKRFQPFRRPPRQQLLQLHAPAISFSGGSRLPFARPQTPQTLPTLPQASKATTLTATCPCHLFFRGFKTAVCPPSNPPNASAGLQGNNSYSYYMPLPSVFQGAQDCRLPALKPPKRFQPFRRPPRQQLLQLHAPAICFSGGSRLPFARPQTPQTLPTLPQASKATTLTATTCPCHLFFRGLKTAVCPPSNPPNASNPSAGLQGNNSYSYMPLPSVFQGAQDCRLPGLKPPKRFRRPPRQQLLQLLHAPAICFSGGSRLPFARPQTPQTLPTLPQASKATTLTATCPCHLFFRGLKTAVCPPSNPPNASNPPAGLQGNNSYSYYMPLPSVFQGVQDCRLPGLKPPKRFQPSCRPPRQQLLQLHAPAICFSGGSRLPFARPQTLQTLPQASKATTFTATCPCHLFFRGFKTAVCPASNPPNASAGLQGNNCYSYMPLLSLSLPLSLGPPK